MSPFEGGYTNSAGQVICWQCSFYDSSDDEDEEFTIFCAKCFVVIPGVRDESSGVIVHRTYSAGRSTTCRACYNQWLAASLVSPQASSANARSLPSRWLSPAVSSLIPAKVAISLAIRLPSCPALPAPVPSLRIPDSTSAAPVLMICVLPAPVSSLFLDRRGASPVLDRPPQGPLGLWRRRQPRITSTRSASSSRRYSTAGRGRRLPAVVENLDRPCDHSRAGFEIGIPL